MINRALNIVAGMAETLAISVIMLGGLLRTLPCAFRRPTGAAMLRDLHADRRFLAVGGFTLEYARSHPTCSLPSPKRLMMRAS